MYILGKKWVDFCGSRSPSETTASTSETVVGRIRTAACASRFSTAAIAASALEVKETGSPVAIVSGEIRRSFWKSATSSAAVSSAFHAGDRPGGHGTPAASSRSVQSAVGAGGAKTTNAGWRPEWLWSASLASRGAAYSRRTNSSRAASISRRGFQSGTPERSRWIGRTINPSEAMSTIAQSL